MKTRTKNPYLYESEEFISWQRGYQRQLPKENNLYYNQGEVAIDEDEKEIPQGPYCYREKVCPYFYKINGKVGCSFLQIQEEQIGDEMLLSDQVKECAVKSD